MKEFELYEKLRDVEGAGVSSTRFGNIPMFWKAAKGCRVYDYAGFEYIDCTSSYGVMGIGYSRPEISQSISETLERVTHTMCEIYPTESYVLALDSIRKVIGREHDQVILTGSGSDSIDVAIKLAYRYTKKKTVICFEGAFHGQTLNALNYTGQREFRDPFSSILPGNVIFVPYPNTYRNNYSSEKEQLDKTIEYIEQQIIENRTDIGSILVEPMQNAAGYIIPPKGFLKELRSICDKYQLLLIIDEIFTGFGRCGQWLMQDYENVRADIVCVGKTMTGGVPAAACVAPKKIMQALDYDGMVPLHGSTFTGNAIVTNAIVATIEVLKKYNLIEKSRKDGDYLRNELKTVFQSINQIGDIRGVGSATMIEFVNDKVTKERNAVVAKDFAQYLQDNRILSLVSGLPYGNCVALCIPFILTKAEINTIIDVCYNYVNSYKSSR